MSVGNYDDIVLIDLSNIKILSTENEPRRHPRGVEYVLVNRIPLVEIDKHTNVTHGKKY